MVPQRTELQAPARPGPRRPPIRGNMHFGTHSRSGGGGPSLLRCAQYVCYKKRGCARSISEEDAAACTPTPPPLLSPRARLSFFYSFSCPLFTPLSFTRHFTLPPTRPRAPGRPRSRAHVPERRVLAERRARRAAPHAALPAARPRRLEVARLAEHEVIIAAEEARLYATAVAAHGGARRGRDATA